MLPRGKSLLYVIKCRESDFYSNAFNWNELMKTLVLTFIFGALFVAGSACYAERATIGETPVVEVLYAKANNYCGASRGPCLILKFAEGYKSCPSISISESDHHYKEIQSLALVSLTAGRPLSIYASNEYCNNPDLVNINNVILR